MTPPPDAASGPEANANGHLATASAGPAATGRLARLIQRLPYSHKLPQIMRYAAVSGVSTVISQSVLASLVFTRTLTPGWANVVAVCIGTVPSFELNRRWVWDHDEVRLFAHAAPFTALSFLGLGISTFTVHFAGLYALHHHLSPVPRTLIVNAASLAAFGTLWVAQFVILDRLMFGKHKPGPTDHDQSDPEPSPDSPSSITNGTVANGTVANGTVADGTVTNGTAAPTASGPMVPGSLPTPHHLGRVLDKA